MEHLILRARILLHYAFSRRIQVGQTVSYYDDGSLLGADTVVVLMGAGKPFITSQLAARSALVGGNVFFYTTATGARPLCYQWRFNGKDLAGATNYLLQLANVRPDQAGLYSVLVSNSWGMVTSTPAALTMTPLIIKSAPMETVRALGGSVSFQPQVQGEGPFTYQWRFNDTDLAGATNETLSLTGLQWEQQGHYSVLVRNPYGAALSEKFKLEVSQIRAWGRNDYGQTNMLQGLGEVIAISSLGSHNLALRSDGTVVAWGLNDYGQTNVPANLTNVVAIAAGHYNNLALKADGTVAAWGGNFYHQTNVPANLDEVKAIASSSMHCLALRSNGTVVAWGDNVFGACNVPAGLSDVVAIAAGSFISIALRIDGSVRAWGSGVAGIPNDLNNVVAIAPGSSHYLALRKDGTVIAWGNNTYGQCSVPGGLTNAIMIAAGYNHSLALRADGTVVAWGQNEYGQITTPTDLNNVVAVAAGYYHSLALLGVVTTPQVSVRPQLGTNGYFSFNLWGKTGQKYQLQYTGRLAEDAQWLPLTNGTFGMVPKSFVESLAPSSSMRFYRLQLVP